MKTKGGLGEIDAPARGGQLFDLITSDSSAAVALRHELHARPELAHREGPTADTIAAALAVPSRRVAGTGLLARVGDRPGPAIVIRAELDGLPIAERTGASFAARNGAMHACGHDVHSAALTAVVNAAATMAERLPAPLIALFQPSEEAYPSGAAQVVEQRALGQDIGAIVGAHVHPGIPWGSVALDAGPVNASSDTVTLKVEGVGAHAAYPHTGRDPILALAATVLSAEAAITRRLDPLASGVLSFGRLNAGRADNVIPHVAEARGTLRALSEEDRTLLAETIESVSTATAAAHGCDAEVTIDRGAPVLDNDAALVSRARDLLGAIGVGLSPPWRSLGADDFSYFRALGPIAMAFVGLQGAPDFDLRPLHHPEFLPPDAAVAQVARLQASLYLSAAAPSQLS
jgi:amidohydrolase